jgi:hypothetical protein
MHCLKYVIIAFPSIVTLAAVNVIIIVFFLFIILAIFKAELSMPDDVILAFSAILLAIFKVILHLWDVIQVINLLKCTRWSQPVIRLTHRWESVALFHAVVIDVLTHPWPLQMHSLSVHLVFTVCVGSLL